VLIIDAPKNALLPKEEEILADYIAKGKDVLWLIDPTSYPIVTLSHAFNITTLPETIIDYHGQTMGTPNPAITIVDNYPPLPFAEPQTLSAFPWATALFFTPTKSNPWQAQSILITHASTELQDKKGPFNVGMGLTRLQQRVVIIGNSRFLKNGAIENYGNLALGLHILNWLSHDDKLIHIEQPIVKDAILTLHLPSAIAIQYLYPLSPGLLLALTLFIFYRRYKKP
jgi:hypothetical protein